MYRVAANLTPELYYEYARRVYAEMLMSGYTTVAEFHYVHHRPDGTPYDEPNAMGLALARAAHDAGIRLTLLDTCYLHADVQGNDLGERQRRFGDGDVESWVSRVDALDRAIQSDETLRESVRVGAAVHSVRACSQREAQVVAQWSRGEIGDGRNVHNIYSAHGASVRPLHVHLSEQTAENEACREATGMSPVELLDKAGVWGAERRRRACDASEQQRYRHAGRGARAGGNLPDHGSRPRRRHSRRRSDARRRH
jgi:cytosine/adenosine deaminase-related metal-dependent hydrolase